MPLEADASNPKKRVIDVLERLGFALEVSGTGSGQPWSNAAWAVRSFPGDLVQAWQAGELRSIRGVGPSTAEVIDAVLGGRVPPRLAELEAGLPPELARIKKVRGLGAKRVGQLWRELGIGSLSELEYACRENRLLGLEGFGPKLQAQVLEETQRLAADARLFRRDQVAGALAELRILVPEAQVVGSWRRGLELVEVLEVLVAGPTALEARSRLPTFAADEDPPSLVGTLAQVPVVVHLCVDGAQAGLTRLRLTGSAEHVAAVEARAAARGVELEALDAATEEGVYAALDLHPTAPERREAGEALLPRAASPRRLLTLADVRGSLHNHTVASDGLDTLAAMREGARALGLSWLGVTEHSQTSSYARGLEVERLAAQRTEVSRANAEGHPVALLAGVESDILEDGSLDYDDAVLAGLDCVVASVHQRHGQDGAGITARLVRAARHPRTTVLGHPTGRLLGGRPASAIDLDDVLVACRATGCAIELNASPQRLDLCPEHAAAARDAGVLVVLSADAHSVAALANLEHGVAVARRAGLTPYDVPSCWPLETVRAWLADRTVRP